jgi:MFS family permease
MCIAGSGLLAQTMASQLGDQRQYVWFTSCITIVTLSTILPCSQAADYWGRKPIILITTVGGIIGAIIISRAQTIGMAIAGFCIVGVAFGCQSVCYAVPSEVLHRKHRAFGQAAANIASGSGAFVGVLVGGALTRNGNAENFRIYWYINCGTFVFGFVGVLFGYNPPPRELQLSLTTSEKLRRMDWIGGSLVAVGLALFSTGLQWSGNPYGWSDGHVLGSFITGVCLLITFCVYEWRGTHEGILHHGLFGDRNFPISMSDRRA